MVISRQEELWLLDSLSYHKQGYPWSAWAKLRRDDPIHYVERENAVSFWAVTRYRDILDIEANTEVYKNGPRLVIDGAGERALRLVVNMDPPEHAVHRAIANRYFMPRQIEWVKRYAEEIVTEALNKAMERNGDVLDLQEDVANLVPTAVISAYLGAPPEMWHRIIDWANVISNAYDPTIYKDRSPEQMTQEATMQMCQVHAATFDDRRKNPRDDFMTALVTAKVDGKPLTDVELYSWAILLTTAGHETTQSTFVMAVEALMKFPDQLAKLKANLDLLPRAIDEFLRYLSPAIHFIRTPSRDVELHGKKIRAGEHLAMFYPSANRDEDVFRNADQLDIERYPNRHLAFGCGPHQCIGMHLARLELRVMLEQFLRRVEKIEMAGAPVYVCNTATGGYRNFPVRMTVRPKS